MAHQHKARKQPQDVYAQQGKALVSLVQRLRGWVGSDPSREPELADALVKLTAHRLLGHGYAAAAADAQEAVRRAAQLLTATGPIGPYTSLTDASRYVTAVVHLATIQAGVGLPDTAGQTIETLREIQNELRDLRLEEQLEPRTAIWALSCSARAGLASGDVATANAYADAALARLAESGLRTEPDAAYLAMDTDRLASDCRWAAGRAEEALGYLHAAKDRYDELVGGRLKEPARLSPALVERLAEPLLGLYRDMADRLAASGEVDLSLVTRRALVDLLQQLAGRLKDPGRIQLASALADLACDLLAVNRVDEAEAAADEAAATVLNWSGAVSNQLLVTGARARVLTLAGRGAEAVMMLGQVLPADAEESPSAAYAWGLSALADALRVEGEIDAAESTEQAFNDLAGDLVGRAREGTDARSAVRDLARGVVSLGAESLNWGSLPATASYAATTASAVGTDKADIVGRNGELQDTAAWIEAQRADAHRLELIRLEQARVEAERRDAERVRAERIAADQLAAERAKTEQLERRETERRAAAEEAERVERKRRREERLEAHRLDVERLAAERREAERLEADRRAAERRLADPAEAERLELERLRAELAELEREETRAQAERVERERAEAERVERERVEAERVERERVEAERVEVERVEAERVEVERVEAERVERERVERERAEVERAEVERVEAERAEADRSHPVEQDELVVAQQAWRDALARGDRRGSRAANERVVELLRPLAEGDLAQYGLQLRSALEALSSARLRSGDVWGSRAPAREAKALAKTLGN